MQIIPLSEGTFTIDQSKQFVPFSKGADSIGERSAGSLLVEVQPFVVITEKDTLLLDTGLGFTEPDGSLQIHHNLVRAGVNPMDVTKVLLTHLHKDHAGGIGVEQPMIHLYQLSFPNAIYYVQQKELTFAFDTGFPSFIPKELEILRKTDRLVLLDGPGLLDGYIEYAPSGGHSPFHQVYWIRENNQTIFFGGDEAPQYHQMKNRFVAKYDYDGKKAMEMRQAWWAQGQKEGWSFLFYHDVKSPVVQAGTALPEIL
jgi:glyoxylase-like metal-dependent hydrolase (beta-lactamase superfamily II)